ncbi:MAG: aldo/keto reductase [Solirubrobacterales bacterium]
MTVFGRCDWDVSPLGLGTYCLTADWGVPREEALAVLRRAVELGVDLIDTAPLYGGGEAEQLVAVALGERGGWRLIDKVGRFEQSIYRRRVEEAYAERALIRAQVEHSLHLLRRDRIDLLLVHEADDPAWWTELGRAEGPVMDELAALREEGLVERIGISAREPAATARLVGSGAFDALLFVHHLNAVWQEAGDVVLPVAAEHGTAIAVGAPYRRGMLLRADEEHLAALARRGDVPAAMVDRLRRLGAIAAGAGLEMGEVSLRWLLSLPGVETVFVGAENIAQLEENHAWALRGPLPEDVLAAIAGLREAAPLPGGSR